MIHFASFMNPNWDIDLLPHWIAHYKALELDTYTVYLHIPKCENDIASLSAKKMLEKRGFTVIFVNGDFRDGALRNETLTAFRLTLPQNDFLMTADSDEFQMWTKKPGEVMSNRDVMTGFLMDVYDSSLHDANSYEGLTYQYPYRLRELERVIFKDCPDPNLNYGKICIARAGVPVCFVGSHEINGDAGHGLRVSSEVEILHFRWRTSVLNRLMAKTYYKLEHLNAIMDYFKVDKIEVPHV